MIGIKHTLEGKSGDSLDGILGHKPATQPPVVLGSGEVSYCANIQSSIKKMMKRWIIKDVADSTSDEIPVTCTVADMTKMPVKW